MTHRSPRPPVPRILLAVLTLALTCLARGQATSTVDSAFEQQLADLDSRAAQIVDLTATFDQEKSSPLLRKALKSSGQLVARGSVMVWKTTTPSRTVLRVDPNSLRLLYVDQKVLEVYPIDAKLAHLAANPLPRLKLLREHFSIAPRDTSSEFWTLLLTPLHEEFKRHVEQVVVTLDPKQAVIVGFEMTDADGERTNIRFSNVRLNTSVPDTELELSLPPGTKIVQPLDVRQ